jgi:hypothetical protein
MNSLDGYFAAIQSYKFPEHLNLKKSNTVKTSNIAHFLFPQFGPLLIMSLNLCQFYIQHQSGVCFYSRYFSTVICSMTIEEAGHRKEVKRLRKGDYDDVVYISYVSWKLG